MLNRRGFIGGALALVCAPAIVRVTSLMPVSTALVPARARTDLELWRSVVERGLAARGSLAVPLEYRRPRRAPCEVSDVLRELAARHQDLEEAARASPCTYADGAEADAYRPIDRVQPMRIYNVDYPDRRIVAYGNGWVADGAVDAWRNHDLSIVGLRVR
jgi:hypothetical protein